MKRDTIISSFRSILLSSLLLIHAAASVHALADDFVAQARLKLGEVVEEQAKLRQAAAAQDAEAILDAQSRIKELRRDARLLFGRGGAGESDEVALLSEYAGLLEQTRDYDLAAKALRRAISFDPTAELWLRLGGSLARMGETEAAEATDAFTQCLSLEPDDSVRVRCIAESGGLYFKLGLFDIAARRFRDVVELDDTNVPARIHLASLAVREGRMLDASTTLDAMGRFEPGPDALLRQRLEQALLDFERGRLWFPDAAADHFAYGKLLFRVGRLPECALALERSLSLDPKNYVGWNLLGSVTEQLGDRVRSREAFSESLGVHPEQPRTRDAIERLDAQIEAVSPRAIAPPP